jgi:hypothetical protein
MVPAPRVRTTAFAKTSASPIDRGFKVFGFEELGLK